MITNHVSTVDAEVLGQNRTVELLDKAAGLLRPERRYAVFDLYELEQEFMRVLGATAAGPAATVREHLIDLYFTCLEGRQHIVVEDVNGAPCSRHG